MLPSVDTNLVTIRTGRLAPYMLFIVSLLLIQHVK